MKKYENFTGYILSWLFGIVFLVTGAMNVNLKPLSSVVLLIIGIILLPPVNMMLNAKLDLKLTNRTRIVFLLLLLVIGALTIASMCNWFYCQANLT